MLRVLHVIGAMDRGGAETMIMNFYRAIDRTKVQFDFLVHEQRECDYDAEIEALGGKIYRLPRFTGVNYFTYRKGCREFFAAHDEHPIVHGHIGSCAAIYLAEAKRAGRYAIAHSHAQNYEGGLAGALFRLASHPTRKIADFFFGCSLRAGVDRFGSGVANGSCFSLLKNGVSLSLHEFDETVRREVREELNIADSAPVVGHVGRFTEVKNHAFLIDVFSRIRDRLPDAVLVLAGRGELERAVRNEVEARGLSDAVRFLGVRDDVSRVLMAMDVFVFPSRKEGLPVALVEAQASGLSCVISSGVSEEAIVDPDAVRLSLADGAARWADEVVLQYKRGKDVDRTRATDTVRSSGFDIAEGARWLQEFYLSRQADDNRFRL